MYKIYDYYHTLVQCGGGRRWTIKNRLRHCTAFRYPGDLRALVYPYPREIYYNTMNTRVCCIILLCDTHYTLCVTHLHPGRGDNVY